MANSIAESHGKGVSPTHCVFFGLRLGKEHFERVIWDGLTVGGERRRVRVKNAQPEVMEMKQERRMRTANERVGGVGLAGNVTMCGTDPFMSLWSSTVTHTGKISTINLKNGGFDEDASILMSKWGWLEAVQPKSFTQNYKQYGKYQCYVKKGTKKRDVVQALGQTNYNLLKFMKLNTVKILCVVFSLICVSCDSKQSRRIMVAGKFKEIKVGMKREEVERILGNPLGIGAGTDVFYIRPEPEGGKYESTFSHGQIRILYSPTNTVLEKKFIGS